MDLLGAEVDADLLQSEINLLRAELAVPVEVEFIECRLQAVIGLGMDQTLKGCGGLCRRRILAAKRRRRLRRVVFDPTGHLRAVFLVRARCTQRSQRSEHL